MSRGVVCRNLVTGKMESYAGHAVLLATGGYGNMFYLSTNAVNSNATASWRCHKRGALFANPCFTQIHPAPADISRVAATVFDPPSSPPTTNPRTVRPTIMTKIVVKTFLTRFVIACMSRPLSFP